MFYEKLLQICDVKNISVTKLVEELGLSSGNLSKWKSGGKPRSDTLIKIAEKLGVPVAYFLSENDSDKATKWYARYSQLTPEQQTLVEDMFRQFEKK